MLAFPVSCEGRRCQRARLGGSAPRSMSAAKKARTGGPDTLPPDAKREAFEGWLRSRGAWWAEDLVAIRSPDHKARRLQPSHPGVELRANLKSISHRCHLFEVAFAWELTNETIHLPLGCLQGG